MRDCGCCGGDLEYYSAMDHLNKTGMNRKRAKYSDAALVAVATGAAVFLTQTTAPTVLASPSSAIVCTLGTAATATVVDVGGGVTGAVASATTTSVATSSPLSSSSPLDRSLSTPALSVSPSQYLVSNSSTLSDLDSYLQGLLNADASASQADPQPLAVAAAPSAAAAVPIDFDITEAAHHMRLQWLLLMQSWGLITPVEDRELSRLIPAFQAAARSHHKDAQLISLRELVRRYGNTYTNWPRL